MSLWSVDLSRWGDVIRRWFPVALELARHRATLAGPVHVKLEAIGNPIVNEHDLVSIPVTVRVSVESSELAELVRLNPVRALGGLSVKIPKFEWPMVSSSGGAITADWPAGARPAINVPALDPQVASVTIRPDGTGSVEIQRGPDGTITY